MTIADKIYLIIIAFAFTFAVAISSAPAYALTFNQPIGGKFAPGAFDIFTPVPFCGNTVTVMTRFNIPVTLVWVAPRVYRNFYFTPFHVGTNMIGTVLPNPNAACPLPILKMFGSSLSPSLR